MNNKPTEEQGKTTVTEEDLTAAIKTLEAGKYWGVGIEEIKKRDQEMMDKIVEKLKPTLDRLRKHDTGEEEIKPIKI